MFDRVFDSKRRFSTTLCVLRFIPNDLTYGRVGIVVSKRNVRLAVTRNLLRRIIKEEFRLHQDLLCRYDVVFVIHRQAANATNIEFQQCINKLIGLLAARPSGP